MLPNFTANFRKLTAKSANAGARLATSFTVMVLIPFAVIGVYIGFVASDRYVSESKVTVKDSGGSPRDAASLAVSLISGGSGNSREENLVLKNYILSLDMLKYLDSTLGLRKEYEGHGDRLSRLSPSASQERFFRYYLRHIEVNHDETSGTLIIRTQAFEPEFSRRLNSAITYQCEQFINESSHHIAEEQLRFISGELSRANENVVATRQQLLAFQNRNNVLDPVEQAKAMSIFVMQLEAELARQEAELKHLRTFLAEDSSQVISLRGKVDSLSQQLQEEKRKMSGGQGGKLNAVSSQYLLLQFQAGLALDKYKATLTAYEKARIESSRKVKNLVVITSPHRQEDAEYPRRGYILTTAIIGLLILYGVTRLIIATIEDHKE